MNMKHFLTLTLCVLASIAALAQSKQPVNFNNSDLPAQLVEYLNQGTSDNEKKSQNAKLIKQFTPVYNAMELDMKDRVVEIFVTMQKLRARQLPDAYNFIETLDALALKGDMGNFEQWIASLEYLQQRNKSMKDFNAFVSFMQSFLADNMLNDSKSSKWQVQQGTPYKLLLEGKEIVLVFAKPFDLYYNSDKDEGTIYGTTGRFNYFGAEWKGRGGRIGWDRTGIPSEVCHADLGYYEAVLKFPKFSADSVKFINTNYFQSPIYGHIDEMLTGKMDPDKYLYPKFQSYQKNFKLKGIAKGVDYSGGFMMNGAKFITSDPKNPASLIFHRAGKPFVAVSSPKFTITDKRIVSENAAVKIYIGDDSIFNKGITVRYIMADNKVLFINSLKRNYYSPYNNTYHNLDMHCESMVWLMDKDVLEMSMLNESGAQSTSTFESKDYFTDAKFRQIQGIDQLSPVIRVYRYMESRDMIYDFYVDELAQYIHMDVIQAKSMVHTLAHSGLVSYDENAGRVFVNDKLVSYAKAYSKVKDNDYDAIVLESDTKGVNASLDLKSNDLKMHGVKKFVVSDSQRVVIAPKGGEITVRKNREIHFDGRIDAGKFFMYVTGARFLYDDFMLDMPQVDSLYFYVTQFNNAQKDHIVYTPLFNLTANIQIDKPDNHNGLKKNKGYPMLNSLKDSYVYYDRKEIYGGAYKRDAFYYTLKPFVIKDMLDFVTDSLYFNGSLTSAGIFPEIVEPLRVQKDYSLGFVRKTPAAGLPAYGGKGNYVQKVDLSYKGFRGEGTVKYLAAEIRSKQIVFLPDSMISVSDTFFLAENGTYPDVHNGRCFQRWYPYRDSMRVSMVRGGKPFAMYRNDATLTGNVTIMPGNAYAAGTAEVKDGTLASRRFSLHSRDIAAKVSTFTLRSDRYNNVAFAAQDIQSAVDFDKRQGEFATNRATDRVMLPLVQYVAYIDKFTWDMDKQQVDLRNSKSLSTDGMEMLGIRERVARPDMPGARLVSSDPKQDSLSFHAVRSIYNYNDAVLQCKKVFLVDVADVAVAPAGDTLRIGPNGTVDLLRHSQILASKGTKYHHFYDADVMIGGARQYAAKGTYNYVDEEEQRRRIHFDTIAPNAAGHTVAKAFIPADSNFRLSAAFGFAGRVTAEAEKEFLYFDGGVKLLHHCTPESELALLAYADYLDPRNIGITVPELPTDWKGQPISAGILFNRTADLMPYPAFLTTNRIADNDLLKASGRLVYDKDSKKYIIASQEKIDDFANTYAPYLTLDTRTCMAVGEGPVNFNQRSNFFSMLQYGTVQADGRDATKASIKSVFGITFPFDEKVRDVMAQYIADDLRVAPASDENELLRSACRYYMGAEDGNTAYLTYRMNGFFGKVPKEMESTILFENVEWHYSPALGWYHDGTVVLSSIGKKELHLTVQAKMQLNRRGTATYLTIYLQVAGDHWYYFNYECTSQQMVIQSSVGEWVDMIKGLSAEKRSFGGTGSAGNFSYRLSTSRNEVPNFLMRFGGGSSTSDDDE